jgi:hypothetical protein
MKSVPTFARAEDGVERAGLLRVDLLHGQQQVVKMLVSLVCVHLREKTLSSKCNHFLTFPSLAQVIL